ncbi:sulfur relay protein DsrC [Candidatus Parabeggiatoa sp. HSG14]|uniref:sulfur relay protein DsrC n=1 Tax=Candidatus Parabeggiatoa sp. HSG14 TaxID=3055593 RepID=UPI0025A7C1BE|nr:sulfur relay protein DsrC [Thiotrichales bacterium HSG14]
MLNLSEILIQHHELQTFEELVELVKQHTKTTEERFFRMDILPPFSDTPDNWEDRLEAAFY